MTGFQSDRGSAGPRVLMLPDLGPTNPYLDLLTSSLRQLGVHVELTRRSGRRSLTNAVRARGRPDLIHLQWHHRFFVRRNDTLAGAVIAGSAFLWDCMAMRRAGIPFVWTVHNVVNHERRFERWERIASRILARLVDRLHVHCRAAVPIVAEAYGVPAERIAVVPHGHYMDAYPAAPGRARARDGLGLPEDARVFLFFGQIRPYKGVEALIERFSRLPGPDLRLLVVGDPRSASTRRDLERRAAGDDRIRLHLEFTDARALVRYLSASDAVVLPYRDVLTSGSAILAASFGRPAILPAVGCMSEMPAQAAILYDPGDSDTADDGDALGRAFERALQAPLDEMGAAARRHVARFPWSRVAEQLARLYDRLTASGAPRAEPRAVAHAGPTAADPQPTGGRGGR